MATQDDRQEIDLQAGDNADIKVLRDVHGDVYMGTRPDRPIDQSDLRPGRSTGEIERTAELARLDGWRRSQGDRWAVIVGPGGAGKSTLASQWFDRPQKAEPWAGRLWTDLGRGQGFAEVARRAIVQFGAANQEQAERLEESELLRLLLLKLQQSPCLWVLDNLETVLEGRELPADYREFWEQWRSCRGAAGWVLFTSRDLPAGMGTRRIDLAEGFSIEQGANFLRDRGIRGAEAELRAFSAQVHGYPLILGLAAGFLVTQCDADPHLSKLPADFFAIADQHRDDPQATLETVLQWSFERLSPELRDWLGRLCALRVAFAFETEDYPNLLPELAGRSFLIQDCLPLTDPDAPRQFVYRWQPIVQQFVQRQQPDLIEAHRFAIAYHDQRYVGLGKWQTKADINNYIEDWHHEGELARLTGDRQGEANSLGNLGNAYDSLGQVQQAFNVYKQSLAIIREIGDQRGEANSLVGLGNAYYYLGQFQQAIDCYDQSLAIAREIGDQRGEGNSLGSLGNAYDSLGQFQQAIDCYDQSLVIARKIGDRQGEAASLANIGNTYRALGQFQRAIDYQEQALAIVREIGDRQGEATFLGNLGNAYYSLGQYQRAIDFHEQSLAIKREIGDRQGEANSLCGLGNAYDSLGQFQQAIDFHEQSLTIKREIGDRSGEGGSLCNLGNAYDSLGQHQRAINFYEQALVICREVGHRQFTANSLGGLGNAYYSLGQYQRAIDFHKQSLAIKREIGNRQGEANSLWGLGDAWAKLGKIWEAKTAYESARDLFRELGLDHEVATCEELLAGLTQVISVEIPRAPQIGEPSPNHRPQRSGSSWWVRLWRAWRR
ncbi:MULTISPECIES: tetratricopeptide repeat protein [unclassified Limnothrix]|uniref:tetratricopeptide repeat protein n=1 Tax=unclassified Limnothrix TaxID=2632864 RepID=UPI0018EF4996|nr:MULTISPECIES: tetratricopeptide repeat protein [unclassified Limnothrix]